MFTSWVALSSSVVRLLSIESLIKEEVGACWIGRARLLGVRVANESSKPLIAFCNGKAWGWDWSGRRFPQSIFPPWEGTWMEGQVDQHRCDGWLTAEGPRTEGFVVLWTLRHVSEGVRGGERVRRGKVLDRVRMREHVLKSPRDFPGGPVVKTPCFQCMGYGFHPQSRS